MKIRSQPLYPRARWLNRPMNSGAYRPWLLEKGSLTKRLKAHAKHFAVQPLLQDRCKPAVDEAYLLGLVQYQKDLHREVMLLDGHQALVFARSVLPVKSLHGDWQGLGRLGNQPLGAALFSNPRMARTPLQFRKIGQHHALYRRATSYLVQLPKALWARRSVFKLNSGREILVTEVFLPSVLDL